MLAHKYKIWTWGAELQGGQEDILKFYAGITVVAKRSKYDPYEVFNELVCMQIGKYIGLPIPVGFRVEKDGESYYCSGDISLTEGEFPPADLQALAARHPRLCCGIALFDGWICNADRHGSNIFYCEDDGEVILIDHGQAVMGTVGPSHVKQNEGRLVLRQEFADVLVDFTSFGEWLDRLLSIPEHTISDTFKRACVVGVKESEAEEAVNLLLTRRRNIDKLFKENGDIFPNRTRLVFNPFVADTEYDDPPDFTI